MLPSNIGPRETVVSPGLEVKIQSPLPLDDAALL